MAYWGFCLQLAFATVLATFACTLTLCPVEAGAQVAVPELPEKPTLSPKAEKKAVKAYARAQRYFKRRRWKKALVQANKAWTAIPNATTALARALVMSELEDRNAAFVAYLTALALSPAEEEMDLVRSGLTELGPQTTPPMGWLVLGVAPLEARVRVAGRMIEAPYTIGIERGAHPVVVEAEGYETVSTTVVVTAGEGQTLTYTLAKAVPEPAPVAPPPPIEPPPPPVSDPLVVRAPPEPAWHRDPLLAWSLIGGGGALVLGGVGATAWAAASSDDAEQYRSPSPDLSAPERRTRYNAAVSDMKTAHALSGVLYGVGGGAVVAGLVLLVWEPAGEASGDAAPSVTPAATLAPDGGFVSLTTRF